MQCNVQACINSSIIYIILETKDQTDKQTDGVKAQTLVELECNTIKMLFESRPRSNGLKLGVSVGGVCLRDRMTPNSILPVLISPQNRVSMWMEGGVSVGGVCLRDRMTPNSILPVLISPQNRVRV